ncbi:MAG: hypothetical protein AB1488_12125 [Nitrospirota bacterium]
MAAEKGQVVMVETGPIVLYWTCPNCNRDNQADIKRGFDHIKEIECECGTVITRQGEVPWVVK